MHPARLYFAIGSSPSATIPFIFEFFFSSVAVGAVSSHQEGRRFLSQLVTSCHRCERTVCNRPAACNCLREFQEVQTSTKMQMSSFRVVQSDLKQDSLGQIHTSTIQKNLKYGFCVCAAPGEVRLLTKNQTSVIVGFRSAIQTLLFLLRTNAPAA